MAQPLFGSIIVVTMLVFFIGFWGILIGGTKLYEAMRSKDAGAGILGALSIVFGIILLIFPWGAALALPLIAGAFALLAGICSVGVGFSGQVGSGLNPLTLFSEILQMFPIHLLLIPT